MKRRKFLGFAGVSMAAVALAGSVRVLTIPFEKAAVDLIERELGFLNLHRDGVKEFVAAYAETRDRKYKWAIKGYTVLGVRSSQSGKVHQLVSAYLLSTDFFQNKMDESRVVRFVGLYDPYKRPCAHPFARQRV